MESMFVSEIYVSLPLSNSQHINFSHLVLIKMILAISNLELRDGLSSQYLHDLTHQMTFWIMTMNGNQ